VVAANGQAAAYGDSLARILQHHGHDVQREYYVNDAGSQIARFGESVIARANGTEVPEGGYQGEYVVELAGEGMTLSGIRRVLQLEAQVKTLEAERDALRTAIASRDALLADRQRDQSRP